jgi:hypothetical protein
MGSGRPLLFAKVERSRIWYPDGYYDVAACKSRALIILASPILSAISRAVQTSACDIRICTMLYQPNCSVDLSAQHTDVQRQSVLPWVSWVIPNSFVILVRSLAEFPGLFFQSFSLTSAPYSRSRLMKSILPSPAAACTALDCSTIDPCLSRSLTTSNEA